MKTTNYLREYDPAVRDWKSADRVSAEMHLMYAMTLRRHQPPKPKPLARLVGLLCRPLRKRHTTTRQ